MDGADWWADLGWSTMTGSSVSCAGECFQMSKEAWLEEVVVERERNR